MRPRPSNPTRNRVTHSSPTTNSRHGMRADRDGGSQREATNLPRAAATTGKVGCGGSLASVRLTTRPLAPMGWGERGGFWRMRRCALAASVARARGGGGEARGAGRSTSLSPLAALATATF
nr:unnamed protein product [Digitaria exilis]